MMSSFINNINNADYRDHRSATVPALRSKTHRKRYRNVNTALLGSIASQHVTPGISARMDGRVVWNDKNKYVYSTSFWFPSLFLLRVRLFKVGC